MKKIYNDTITTISKYDDFDEMRNDLFSMYNENVTMCVCDNISIINYDTMCILNDCYNDFNKYINKINVISFHNEYYLFDNNDETFIIFVDKHYKIHTYDLYTNEFNYCIIFDNKICCTINELSNAIINKLNEQITINEMKNIIIEN